MSRKIDYNEIVPRALSGSRNTTVIQPTGGIQAYGPGSTLQYQVISGGGYMDPASLYCRAKVTIDNPTGNTGAGATVFSPNGIASCFESIRITSSSNDLIYYCDEIGVLQSILQYNTVSEDYSKYSGSMQGFYDNVTDEGCLGGIADVSTSKDFVFFLNMCPIFSMDKFLPLKFMAGPYAMLIELRLGQAVDVLHTLLEPVAPRTGSAVTYNFSENEMVYDLVHLDPEFDASMEEALNDGAVLTMGFQSIQHQQQTLPVGVSTFNTIWNLPDRSINYILWAFVEQAYKNKLEHSVTDKLVRPKAGPGYSYSVTHSAKQYPSNGLYKNSDMMMQLAKCFGRMKLSAINPNTLNRESYFGEKGNLTDSNVEALKAHKHTLGLSMEIFADDEASYDGVNNLSQNVAPIVLKLNVNQTAGSAKNIDCFWVSDRTLYISANRTSVET
jgi:hypothetical protein